ncbi:MULTISPECIES: hypothetical protein [unclassified Paenibacillus]|uniref:hypothetical protein n=1 Tax=unclassified Paenibacillus TaxID=185978 RepID=UPI001AE2FDAC|nr:MULTISPECIES: hypothetical protein [unclassified Paenibacillus]MBP1157052.1 hypothetical protein [Paenibacillus sp. PvP091]MBP1172209.1 hypothetical protein [Paenibacillus sp. PvR098]MBP2438590.1 hypothetical protein [Paenibacillus sp. PvP052]
MSHPKDDYGVLGNEIEVDSDVNEDRNREEQLDNSLEAWYGNIEDQVKQKLDLTNVPQDNVFESAVGLDEVPSKVQQISQ